MGSRNCKECKCKKSKHKNNDDVDYKKRSCTRCCPPKDWCTCHNSRCRKSLCSTDFSIRLAGLQDGLNFRLRQLLWCEAEFKLDNGNTVIGTVVSVGNNFVEVIVKETFPLECEDDVEEGIEEASEKEVDKEFDEKDEERQHKKGTSWIFSIDKIAIIKTASYCHRPEE